MQEMAGALKSGSGLNNKRSKKRMVNNGKCKICGEPHHHPCESSTDKDTKPDDLYTDRDTATSSDNSDDLVGDCCGCESPSLVHVTYHWDEKNEYGKFCALCRKDVRSATSSDGVLRQIMAEYDAAKDDACFEEGHPIFRMAEEIDRLRAALQGSDSK